MTNWFKTISIYLVISVCYNINLVSNKDKKLKTHEQFVYHMLNHQLHHGCTSCSKFSKVNIYHSSQILSCRQMFSYCNIRTAGTYTTTAPYVSWNKFLNDIYSVPYWFCAFFFLENQIHDSLMHDKIKIIASINLITSVVFAELFFIINLDTKYS